MAPRIRAIDVRTGLTEEELRALLDHMARRTGVRRVEAGSGPRIEFTPADEPVAELTSGGELRPVEPNVLRIGTPESYVHEVVAANLTIPSTPDDKEGVREVTEDEARGVELPRVIRYRRKHGKKDREEVGFDLGTAPNLIRAEGGIDLKALVAMLVLRVRALEREVAELRDAMTGRGGGGSAP